MENFYSTFAEGYKDLLTEVLRSYNFESAPRGKKIRELVNFKFTIAHPNKNLYKNKIRSSQVKYIANEFIWYLAGDLNVDFISKFGKMWDSLRNPNSKFVNSNYGYLIFYDRNPVGLTQWQWALNSLKKDNDTRQAILHFNSSNHQFNGVKDFPCTLYAIFQIRNNKLDFTVHMRSNDIILGLPTDFAFFNFLHQHMYLSLENDIKNLKMGTYTHFANSLHLYEQHFGLVEQMLDHPFVEDKFPTPYYRYFDEFSVPTPFCEDLCNYVYNLQNGKSVSSKEIKFVDDFMNWIIKNV